MKITILPLLLILAVLMSCEKGKEGGAFTLNPSFAQLADTVSYDSAYFLVVNYSSADELQNNTALFLDSTTFHHTMVLSLDKSDKENWNFKTPEINLKLGRYVIKKYDLVDNSGNVIYCIPYQVPEKYKSGYGLTSIIVSPLPFSINVTGDNTGFVNFIIKK
jgi:hypothetical protein